MFNKERGLKLVFFPFLIACERHIFFLPFHSGGMRNRLRSCWDQKIHQCYSDTRRVRWVCKRTACVFAKQFQIAIWGWDQQAFLVGTGQSLHLSFATCKIFNIFSQGSTQKISIFLVLTNTNILQTLQKILSRRA